VGVWLSACSVAVIPFDEPVTTGSGSGDSTGADAVVVPPPWVEDPPPWCEEPPWEPPLPECDECDVPPLPECEVPEFEPDDDEPPVDPDEDDPLDEELLPLEPVLLAPVPPFDEEAVSEPEEDDPVDAALVPLLAEDEDPDAFADAPPEAC
jgi:hypothetical protein